MSPLIGHILRRAFRSLWENLYLNLVSMGVITAAVLLMGIFLTVMYNLNSIVQDWERDVHISAYFHPDIPVERRFEIKEQVAAMTGVSSVRYVSEQDARAYLEARIPDVVPVLAELGDNVLPSSLEITLEKDYTQPGAIESIAVQLALPEFQDLDYGQQWVERFNSFLSLLQLLGIILGALIILATVFLVANTIHLVVYNRREELETMRLVGATDTFVGVPFLVEGLVQGLLGSGLAIGALYLVHRLVVLRLQSALQLHWQLLLLLLLVGMALGVIGSAMAVVRFLRKVT